MHQELLAKVDNIAEQASETRGCSAATRFSWMEALVNHDKRSAIQTKIVEGFKKVVDEAAVLKTQAEMLARTQRCISAVRALTGEKLYGVELQQKDALAYLQKIIEHRQHLDISCETLK